MRGLIALLVFFLAAPFYQTDAAPHPKVFRAHELSFAKRDSVKIWVFFRDKNASPAVEAVAQRATERIRQSRNLSVSAEAERPVSARHLRQIERLGARVWHTSRWLNAASIWVNPQKLSPIEQLPFVTGFRPVMTFTRQPEPVEPVPFEKFPPWVPELPAPLYADSYGPTITQLDSLNIPIVHTLGYRGQGVMVGMLDDGFQTGHSVFRPLFDSGRVVAKYDFIHNDTTVDFDNTQDSIGQGNHGTETWSVVGGTSPGSFLGGAFKASFVLAKTEWDPTEHKIEEDNWVAGMEWADSIGVGVISSSLGYFAFDPPDPSYVYADLDGQTAVTSIAASKAADLGIVVCNAAGNEGPLANTLITPADAFDILACGAVDSNSNLASFSSRGPTADGRIKPELSAQGVATYLANPTNFFGFTRGNGTSFATPLIACASAVLRNVHPDWAPRQIREALILTANNSAAPNSQKGWGVPDVYKAALFRPDSTVTLEVVRLGNILNLPVGTSSCLIKVVVHNPRGFPVNSPEIFYRDASGSSFSSLSLTPASGDTLTATIPIAEGDREIVLYASANSGMVKDPVFAPVWLYHLPVRPRFLDNADSGSYEWRATGTNSSWGPSGRQSNSGFFSFADSPRGNYRNNSDERWEMSRGVGLDSAANYFLRYFERYALGTGDSVWVEASTDGGANWTPLPGTKRATGALSTWTERIIPLGAYYHAADFRIRFRLKSDAASAADGWFVDNVGILPRGDLNGDGLFSATDVVGELSYVFSGVLPPVPLAAADVNGDLSFSSSDVVCILNAVFATAPCATP